MRKKLQRIKELLPDNWSLYYIYTYVMKTANYGSMKAIHRKHTYILWSRLHLHTQRRSCKTRRTQNQSGPSTNWNSERRGWKKQKKRHTRREKRQTNKDWNIEFAIDTSIFDFDFEITMKSARIIWMYVQKTRNILPARPSAFPLRVAVVVIFSFISKRIELSAEIHSGVCASAIGMRRCFPCICCARVLSTLFSISINW